MAILDFCVISRIGVVLGQCLKPLGLVYGAVDVMAFEWVECRLNQGAAH